VGIEDAGSRIVATEEHQVTTEVVHRPHVAGDEIIDGADTEPSVW
jgi:hypothetical protein